MQKIVKDLIVGEIFRHPHGQMCMRISNPDPFDDIVPYIVLERTSIGKRGSFWGKDNRQKEGLTDNTTVDIGKIGMFEM